ncbi:thermostable hemolysin [Arenimonas sp. MALMAid1274]|uniref:thermostable hemolysin n=1 Tax=Arenimonas sp. MALMAid1274 TaxID=3411630 RepID=UPI003BA244E1
MLSHLTVPTGPSRFHSASRVPADHPARAEVEAFIARVYAERYGARLHSFLPDLVAYRDQDGALQAAVGLRRGTAGPLFVEQYLQVPAEQALRARLGRPVQRAELVEVGGFASRSPGDAREVIVQLTGLLHRAGVPWVLFAATRQLRNAFDRLRLATVVLAEARADCLRDDATDWGSYYEAQPQLLFGDIQAGHAFLQRSRATPAPVHERPIQACTAGAR